MLCFDIEVSMSNCYGMTKACAHASNYELHIICSIKILLYTSRKAQG